MKCEICNEREKVKVSQGKYCCEVCIPPRINFAGIEQRVVIGNGFKTTQARIGELERRVVLNYNKKDCTYDVGRRCENGKVAERPPTY